jgi:hypothetical protein
MVGTIRESKSVEVAINISMLSYHQLFHNRSSTTNRSRLESQHRIVALHMTSQPQAQTLTNTQVTYIKRSKVLPVLVEGFVIEFRELF